MKVLLAIPCYKCAPQIGRLLDSFDSKLISRIETIAIFDNRSPDNTLNVAVAAAKKIDSAKAFQNTENFGLGGTHKIAFQKAKELGFDYVAILHGDDQAKPNELNDLLDIVEKDSSLDAVLGARFMLGSKLCGYSSLRVLGNRFLNFIYQILVRHKIYDLGSGLNIFKVSALTDYMNYDDGFTFNMDLLLGFVRQKRKFIFHPISWGNTDQISNAPTFRVGFKALETLFKWRLGIHKPEAPRRYFSIEVE